MSEIVGRAGFHVQHTKSIGERSAILHEMMRELDDDAIEYWAKRNPNIVVADEPLNEAMVNDGDGTFRRCTDRDEVMAYGDGRIAKLSRKLREDKQNAKTGKMEGGTVTTTMIVAHLPKSMCVEQPDYYPVLDRQGRPVRSLTTGTPKMRSRWVARDRDEARRYFEDVIEYLSENVVPGGAAGVHGYDIQHSESTPHVQILADTFGEDPKRPGALRADASRAWFSHRDVRDDQGKQKSGKAKLRDYHAGLKEHLIACGYDISPDFDEERHLVGLGKAEYERVMDAQRAVEEELWDKGEDLRDYEADLRGDRRDLDERNERLDALQTGLNEREGILDRRELEIPRMRRAAVEDGKKEGYDDGLAEVKQRADEAMKHYIAQLHRNTPKLLDEFLDRKDKQGRSYRPIFEHFVNQRLQQFEADHGVEDLLVLETGDREQFIEDGGASLAAEVAQLQRDRGFTD